MRSVAVPDEGFRSTQQEITMRKSLFLAALLTAAPMMSFAADVPVKVEVIGVQADFVDDDTEQYQKVEKGSVMVLQFTAPEGKVFLKSNTSRDVVLPCNDGAGKALEDAGIKMFFSKVSEDGKKMVCSASTTSLTPDGVLQLVGDVPVTMVKGKAKQPAAAVDVKKGAKANVAGYEVEIKRVEPSNNNKGKTDVTIEVTGKDFVADMEFTSLDGKKLQADKHMTMTSNMGSTSVGTYNYTFDAKPEKMNVVVSLWQGSEQLNVPVNVKANLSGPVK